MKKLLNDLLEQRREILTKMENASPSSEDKLRRKLDEINRQISSLEEEED